MAKLSADGDVTAADALKGIEKVLKLVREIYIRTDSEEVRAALSKMLSDTKAAAYEGLGEEDASVTMLGNLKEEITGLFTRFPKMRQMFAFRRAAVSSIDVPEGVVLYNGVEREIAGDALVREFVEEMLRFYSENGRLPGNTKQARRCVWEISSGRRSAPRIYLTMKDGAVIIIRVAKKGTEKGQIADIDYAEKIARQLHAQ